MAGEQFNVGDRVWLVDNYDYYRGIEEGTTGTIVADDPHFDTCTIVKWDGRGDWFETSKRRLRKMDNNDTKGDDQ